MKTGFSLIVVALCGLLAAQASDTPCFTRETCSAPCFSCETPLGNGVLCLNGSDLVSSSDLACVAADKPKPAPGPPGPPPQCSSFMEEKPCLKSKDVECSWCVSKFTPGGAGTCFKKDQAKFLPPAAYECKDGDDKLKTVHKDKPKPPAPEPPAPEPPAPEPPAPEPKCADFDSKKSCLKGKPEADAVGKKKHDKKHDKKKSIDCEWCTNKYVPGGGGACYDPETAKGLPPFVFDCSKPKAAVARA